MVKNYVTLKAAGNVSMKTEGDEIVVSSKMYDPMTGAETTTREYRITKKHLLVEKEQLQKEIDALEAKIEDIDAMIVDIDAL